MIKIWLDLLCYIQCKFSCYILISFDLSVMCLHKILRDHNDGSTFNEIKMNLTLIVENNSLK